MNTSNSSQNASDSGGTRADHPREIARGYLRRGWAPIPVPFREKGPKHKGWPNLRIAEEELSRYFPGPQVNIGVLLGEASNGLVDIDLDHPLAVELADPFLPATKATFGRSGKPRSHRLYLVQSGSVRTKKLAHPSLGSVVEIRSDGCQTVFPGSVHPSGELVEWAETGEPAVVTRWELEDAAVRLFQEVLRRTGQPFQVPSTADAIVARTVEPQTLLRDLAAEVAGSANGTRNDSLNKAAYILAPHVQNGSLTSDEVMHALKIAGMRAGLADEECMRTIRSGLSASPRQARPNIRSDSKNEPNSSDSEGRKSQVTKLIELANAENGVELFGGAGDDSLAGYASMQNGAVRTTMAIRGEEFRGWLAREFYKRHGVGVTEAALKSASVTIAAKAEHDGARHPVGLRIAEHMGRIYVDLRDQEWRVIEIRSDGWRVLASHESPVRFIRKLGMKALPEPSRGGSVEQLRPFINVADERSFVLIIAWLVNAFRPGRPFPILLVSGQQGSAKSTLCRMLRSLIDPSEAPLCSLPRDERDMIISAKNSWVLAFDNLSKVSPEMSDALCRVATGGGLRMRALFTNDAEAIFHGKRPIILNGIDDVADRPDLLDRSVMVKLEPILDEQRKDESTLGQQFDQIAPQVLGALLDAVCGALAKIGTTKLASKPRMADFALWVSAAEAALGWNPGTFMEAYSLNRNDAHLSALEASPVAAAILDLVGASGPFEGIVSELLGALNGARQGRDDATDRRLGWPTSPQALKNQLLRIAPVLLSQGIKIDFGAQAEGNRKRKLIRISRVPAAETKTDSPAEDAENAEN